ARLTGAVPATHRGRASPGPSLPRIGGGSHPARPDRGSVVVVVLVVVVVVVEDVVFVVLLVLCVLVLILLVPLLVVVVVEVVVVHVEVGVEVALLLPRSLRRLEERL